MKHGSLLFKIKYMGTLTELQSNSSFHVQTPNPFKPLDMMVNATRGLTHAAAAKGISALPETAPPPP